MNGLIVLVTLIGLILGKSYDADDLESTPGFKLPADLANFDTGDPLFNPKGVVEGMILGDIITRVEKLEDFCKLHGNTVGSHSTGSKKTPASRFASILNYFSSSSSSSDDAKTDDTSESTPEPNGFPLGTDQSGLSSKVKEVEDTLQLLHGSVKDFQQESESIQGNLDQVRKEMTSIHQHVYNTQRDITLTKKELMAAIMETNSVLGSHGKSIHRLQMNNSVFAGALSEVRYGLARLSHLNSSVHDAVHSYGRTSRHVDRLARDISLLQNKFHSIKRSVDKTVNSVGPSSRRNNATITYMSRLNRQLAGIKKRMKKVDISKCESGKVMFHNYPFSHGRWPQHKNVKFAKPFVRQPTITLGITQMDVSYKFNTRAGVRVSKKATSGFTITGDGWYNTRLYKLEVSWMACYV